jgi:hypothetical protein
MEISLMERNMVKELSHGKMDRNMMVIGKIIIIMDLELGLSQMEQAKRQNLKWVKEYSG